MRDKLYRITAKRHYKSVVNDAHFVVKNALQDYSGPVAVGVSGGKDSIAMAHIVAQHCNPLVIWNDSGLELPESEGVVSQLSEQLGLEMAIARGCNALDRKIEIGAYKARERADETNRLCIIEPIREILQENHIILEFVGLREEESRTRRMLIRRFGPVHANKRWGCATAWPMRRWLAADVYAYIDEHDLPLHPAYLREDWQDRESIRVSWLWDSTRDNLGDLTYVRRYYPKIYRKMRDAGVIDVF